MPPGTFAIENFPVASVVAVSTVSIVTSAPATGLLVEPSVTVPVTVAYAAAGGSASVLHAAMPASRTTAKAARTNDVIGEALRHAEAAAPMASTVPSGRATGPAYCENALAAIGHTPLVRLNKVTDGAACLVLAKVEYMNPGGSVKDRPALAMLEAAEAQGSLKPGGTIVE